MKTCTFLALVGSTQAAQLKLSEDDGMNNLALAQDKDDMHLAEAESDDSDLAEESDDSDLAEESDDSDLAEESDDQEALAEAESDDLDLAEDSDDDIDLAEYNDDLDLAEDSDDDDLAEDSDEDDLAEESDDDMELGEQEMKAVNHVIAKIQQEVNLAEVDDQTLDQVIDQHQDEALAIAYPQLYAQGSENALATTEQQQKFFKKIKRGIKKIGKKIGKFAKKALKATKKFAVSQLKSQLKAFTMKKFTFKNLLRVGLNVGMAYASGGVGSFASRMAGRYMAKKIGSSMLKKYGKRFVSKYASKYGQKLVRNKSFQRFAKKNIGKFSKAMWRKSRNLRKKAFQYGIKQAKRRFRNKLRGYYNDAKRKLKAFEKRFRSQRRTWWYKNKKHQLKQQMKSYK